MKLYIKNMVCPRCIMSVEQLFEEHGIGIKSVTLGEVELEENLSANELSALETGLEKLGFELLGDPSSKAIEQIKTLLIEKVQNGVEEHFSIRKYLSSHIFRDYSSLSKLFSEVEGITIEQFFILQKIEKAKELLIYNEMSLGEIAFTLGYSSSQHLSGQFKRITGMTPTSFKSLGSRGRRSIDDLS